MKKVTYLTESAKKFSREEAIAKTSEKLGMDPEKMLDALKTYLIKNKKVRKTQNEEYILGD